MLPIVLICCGVVCLFIPGMEGAAIIFGIGAIIGMGEDKNVEQAYQRAEAVGYDMSGDRRSDLLFDLIMAVFFVLPVLAAIFGGE